MTDGPPSPRAAQRAGAAETVAIASLTLALLSFLSPQVGALGHGLKTAVPALLVSFVAITLVSRKAFFRAFVRFRVVFLLGFLFLAQAYIRFAFETSHRGELVHAYITGPVLTFTLLLWIAALSELGDATVQRMRSLLLLGWCLSLAVSLPVLIANPGVARLTMGNRDELVNAARWAPFGVAEYTGYTTMAICICPLFGVAARMGRLARGVALTLVLLTILAILFSTFTMASAMAVLGLVAMLATWVAQGRGPSRVLRLLAIFIVIPVVPTLFVLANNFEQTRFVVTKVERLAKNISSKGLSKGDETARGAWFTHEMNTFADEPFLGYIPGTTGERGHGHSSLSNSLVIFGLFGTLLWVATLGSIFRNAFRFSRDGLARLILAIAWTIFVLSGILNPIWYACETLAALFALTLPADRRPEDASAGDDPAVDGDQLPLEALGGP